MTTMETNNLKRVFETLINILSPVIKEVKKDFEYTEYPKKRTWTTLISECNFDNISNIPDIPGYLIEVTKDNICIFNDNLEYNITPSQILRVYNKIKKTFK